MSVSIGGRVIRAKNWSAGGLLVPADDSIFQQDRIEEGEMLMPCADGIFVLPVQIQPLHRQGGGIGCQFVDMPPRERAIIHAYADFITRGQSATIQQLEDSAKTPVAAEAAAPAPDFSEEPRWRRLLGPAPIKRAAIIGGLLLGIGLLASLSIPAILSKTSLRNWNKTEFLKQANLQLDNDTAHLSELNSKIDLVNNILAAALKGVSTLTSKQIKVLQGGLSSLDKQRKEVEREVESLNEAIARVEGSSIYFVNPFSMPTIREHPDPAPFVTDILRSVGGSAGVEVHTQAEIDKYLLVAKARVKQAEAALSSTRVKRESLERILKRVDDAGAEAGFPQNQRELMQRDVELMRLEEDRLTDVLKLLNDNVDAVGKGNFIYETKLLQRFDSEPTHSLGTATDNHMTD